jgi:hypothetical protein
MNLSKSMSGFNWVKNKEEYYKLRQYLSQFIFDCKAKHKPFLAYKYVLLLNDLNKLGMKRGYICVH